MGVGVEKNKKGKGGEQAHTWNWRRRRRYDSVTLWLPKSCPSLSLRFRSTMLALPTALTRPRALSAGSSRCGGSASSALQGEHGPWATTNTKCMAWLPAGGRVPASRKNSKLARWMSSFS